MNTNRKPPSELTKLKRKMTAFLNQVDNDYLDEWYTTPRAIAEKGLENFLQYLKNPKKWIKEYKKRRYL